ncbi:hypothetical protein V1387_14590 [Allomuricauda taeanensis]|uniref:hypothetical protein n=1 Tax=Flagellimonas taeanensis TaxID=1005926 RepID=UPI002E7AB614|nr:hypothetical protein [Allomuricauda taeanensis]MEE1963920.1 hypothetical protein [Allomuricauda taeanensis]
MDYKDILKQAMEGKAQVDVTYLLTEIIGASVMNQCYLKAILESQVALLMQRGGLNDMDYNRHLEMIMDEINRESEAKFIEILQNIIKK